MNEAHLSAWVEIDLDALKNNMLQVRKLSAKDILIAACIKANAYGHGAVAIAQTLLENGADRLAVAQIEEGIELRLAGYKAPILILGYSIPLRAAEIIYYHLTPTVYSWELASALSLEAVKQGRPISIHIKIDTGMGRIGLQVNAQAVDLVLKISRLPGIYIEGIYTHFATADEKDKRYAIHQFEKFMNFIRALNREGLFIEVMHCSNSAAIIDLPEYHPNMVRPGIMLYGLYPSQEVQTMRAPLRQVLSLKARITHLKKIHAGESVGYGRRFIAQKETTVASLPIGYADGFSRRLSGQAEAIIHGKKVNVIGNICMDQCMLDVTHVANVAMGDVAVLFGSQGESVIPIDEIANKLDTISYEVVTMISRRVPRVYKKNGEIIGISHYALGSLFNPLDGAGIFPRPSSRKYKRPSFKRIKHSKTRRLD